MPKKSSSGRFLGIPYNFDRPKLSRMFRSYWRPGKGMLVEKPFGIGYTLNLANWRSWVVIAVAGFMLVNQRKAEDGSVTVEGEPVEVVVDD